MFVKLALFYCLIWTIIGSAHAALNSFSASQKGTNVLIYTVNAVTTDVARPCYLVWQAGFKSTTSQYKCGAMKSGSHNVVFWGLKASTTYFYSAQITPAVGIPYSVARKKFTTSALPNGIPNIKTSIPYTTATTDLSYVIFHANHSTYGGSLTIADTSGQVVWYTLATDLGGTAIDGFYFDQDTKSIYLILDVSSILKIQFDGTVTTIVSTTSAPYFHHDLLVKDDKLYVLTANSYNYLGTDYINDGFAVYGLDGALVSTWDVFTAGLNPIDYASAAWFTISSIWYSEFGAAPDWTHANGITTREEDGQTKIFVSFRHLNQIVKIDETGSIEWFLGSRGEGSTEVEGDFTLTPSNWFSGQHNPNFADNGDLMLFDNGNASKVTRILELTLDEASMSATIAASADFSYYVSLGRIASYCELIGSATRTSSGHLLGGCGAEGLAVEFDTSGLPILDFSLTDESGTAVLSYRFQPMNTFP